MQQVAATFIEFAHALMDTPHIRQAGLDIAMRQRPGPRYLSCSASKWFNKKALPHDPFETATARLLMPRQTTGSHTVYVGIPQVSQAFPCSGYQPCARDLRKAAAHDQHLAPAC